MNPDFESLADQIAAAARWDTGTDSLHAAVAAYQHQHTKEQAMTPETPKHADFYKLLLAGTRACSLAFLVINSAKDKTVQKVAQDVLRDWGITLETQENPPAAPNPEPEPELIWPPVDRFGSPLETTLSPIYFEHYYHVHEDLTRVHNTGTTGYIIKPENQLTPVSAYWEEERRVWRMKFLPWNGSVTGEIWISHCAVHPGDKIKSEDKVASP